MYVTALFVPIFCNQTSMSVSSSCTKAQCTVVYYRAYAVSQHVDSGSIYDPRWSYIDIDRRKNSFVLRTLPEDGWW